MDWILNYLILELLEHLNSIWGNTLKIPIIRSAIPNSFRIAKLSNFDL